MFGILESLLMQSGVVEQINATATTASLLISTLSGIIIYVITNIRKVRKEELTERDKWIMESMKGVQMIAQKSAETIGQNKEIIKTLYKANLSPEQQIEIENVVTPLLKQADERLRAANEQAAMIKALTTKIFGNAGDVDLDPTIPRESSEISKSLRTV